jgi:hypothetical protein
MPPDRLHDRWSRHAPGRVRDRRRPGHRRGHISFGGYLDRSDPEQELIYQAYIDAVAYARSKGTIIVASAGNEHLRIGAGGRVLSHGPTVTPGTAPEDFQDLLASTRPGRDPRRGRRVLDQPGGRPVLARGR